MSSVENPATVSLVPAAAPAEAGRVVAVWSLMTLFTSCAAIFTRYCKEIPASSIGFWRVLGAGLILLPVFVVIAVRTKPRPLITWGAMLTGALLGVHFATWSWALLHAQLANAALFIALQPAITPLLGRWLTGDRLSRGEYLGTGLACAGMVWVLGGQVMFTRDQLPGSMVALFSMVCCAFYLVLGRRYRSREHVTLFSVPVYLAAAATQAIPALLIGGGIRVPHSTPGLLALAGIILVPTVGGHTLALYLLRHTKAHTIALSIPVQFMLISIAAGFLFGEVPRAWFYPGAVVVLLGVILAILASTRRPKPTT